MYAFLSVPAVLALVPLARELGVSEVARGPAGFVHAYTKAGGPDKLSDAWKEKRENFIRRHLAQAKARNESWWHLTQPTRRHVALAMWAYSPTPTRILRLAGI